VIASLDGEGLEATALLLERFFSEEGFEPPSSGMLERLREYTAAPGRVVLIARSGKDVVGVATVAMGFSLEHGRYAELEDLYVVPDLRRRGLGRRLVEAAAEWVAAHEGRSILVTITPEGERAHGLLGFYAHLGFTDDGRRIIERRLPAGTAEPTRARE
jgi:GNAT superfamily N-acetyltransferase